MLKTAPKGYPKDHPDIDLHRYKTFIVWHTIPDKQVLDKDFLKYLLKVSKAMKPLNYFLDRAF